MLVSSLVDLEAEEGKILQLYKLAIASEKKSYVFKQKTWGGFDHPRLLPAPKSEFLLALGELQNHPGGLHQWDGLCMSPCLPAGALCLFV